MADRSFRGIAANLLELWTDSDTAMEVVGTSLGIFGDPGLDPVAILSRKTPLRDALFDVLLSLVEGGALEMRPLDDGRYAFRWRQDIATAAVTRDTTVTIDMDAPPPQLAEIGQLRAERDEALRREADALGRAEFAEALAAEQKRLLLSPDASPRPEPPSHGPATVFDFEAEADAPVERAVSDAVEGGVVDILAEPGATAAPKPPKRRRAKRIPPPAESAGEPPAGAD